MSTASSANSTNSISDSSKKSENNELYSGDGMYFYCKSMNLTNINFFMVLMFVNS